MRKKKIIKQLIAEQNKDNTRFQYPYKTRKPNSSAQLGSISIGCLWQIIEETGLTDKEFVIFLARNLVGLPYHTIGSFFSVSAPAIYKSLKVIDKKMKEFLKDRNNNMPNTDPFEEKEILTEDAEIKEIIEKKIEQLSPKPDRQRAKKYQDYNY